MNVYRLPSLPRISETMSAFSATGSIATLSAAEQYGQAYAMPFHWFVPALTSIPETVTLEKFLSHFGHFALMFFSPCGLSRTACTLAALSQRTIREIRA